MDSSKLTLRDIADRAVARNGGKGGRALGRVAEKRGLTLSYTTVDKIRAGTYMSTPSAKTLEALSVLSGEPLSVVYDAAGLPMPRGSFADNLPPDADLLEPEQRKIVYDVVRALARQNKELYRLRELEQKAGERDDHAPPMNQAGTQPAQDQTRETTPASRDDERVLPPDEAREAAFRAVRASNASTRGLLDVADRLDEEDAQAAPRAVVGGDVPPPPMGLAARDVGKPSRGQRLREHQDAEGESPDDDRRG